jgi:protease-4
MLLGAVLVVSLLISSLSGPGRVTTNGQWLEEVLVENNNSSHKIAVVGVEGIITGQSLGRGGPSMVDMIKHQLKAAAGDNRVKAVLLKVNSPGGEVLASDDIYREIARFQEETGKPVVASMGSLAASGGYYVAAPCRFIVANDLTITGSIGVIMQGYNYRGLMNKIGLRPQVFKSGRFKDMLSGQRDLENLTPQEEAQLELESQMVQDLIDETYSRFVEVVEQGRTAAFDDTDGKTRPLATDWKDYADGRIFSGRQAHELGFVDALGNFDMAARHARSLAGVTDANLVEYRPPFSLGSLFRLFGRTEATSIKLDLGVDLPALKAGHLYFITPTVLPQ